MAIPLFKSNQCFFFFFCPFVLKLSSMEGAFDKAMEKKKSQMTLLTSRPFREITA